MENEKNKLREKMSKRIAGGLFLAAGLTLSIFTWKFSIVDKIGDPATAKSIINMLIIAGGGLFGLDLAGNLFKK